MRIDSDEVAVKFLFTIRIKKKQFFFAIKLFRPNAQPCTTTGCSSTAREATQEAPRRFVSDHSYNREIVWKPLRIREEEDGIDDYSVYFRIFHSTFAVKLPTIEHRQKTSRLQNLRSTNSDCVFRVFGERRTLYSYHFNGANRPTGQTKSFFTLKDDTDV